MISVMGATGNTGRHVVAELVRRGHRVVQLEREPEARGATVRNFGLVWVSGRSTSELETTLPQGVGSVVYEAAFGDGAWALVAGRSWAAARASASAPALAGALTTLAPLREWRFLSVQTATSAPSRRRRTVSGFTRAARGTYQARMTTRAKRA